MHENTVDELRQASPAGGVFDAQKKPSTKAIEAMKEWRDEQADTELEAEWCDAVIHAMRQAEREEW